LSSIPTEVVPLAVGAAVSPLSLIVLLIVLLTPRGLPNGLAFAMGWSSALLVVPSITMALLGMGATLDVHGETGAALQALLGLSLMYLAVRQWNRRPRNGAEAVVPRWLMVVDRCTPWRAFGIGYVLVVANPKTLALALAVGAAVADAGAASSDRIRALLVFTTLGSAGVAVPLALRIALGVRAAGMLRKWREWLAAHGTSGACVLLALIGALLVYRAAMA
jgi:threonine/homoserine/homoserine lactone efflux protein